MLLGSFPTVCWRKPVTKIEGMTFTNVHDKSLCEGRRCVFHNPSNHHMRNMRLLWRGDRGIFERLCSHGVGHPDPDQFDYWRETGREYEMVHGCDGCCIDPFSDIRKENE